MRTGSRTDSTPDVVPAIHPEEIANPDIDLGYCDAIHGIQDEKAHTIAYWAGYRDGLIARKRLPA